MVASNKSAQIAILVQRKTPAPVAAVASNGSSSRSRAGSAKRGRASAATAVPRSSKRGRTAAHSMPSTASEQQEQQHQQAVEHSLVEMQRKYAELSAKDQQKYGALQLQYEELMRQSQHYQSNIANCSQLKETHSQDLEELHRLRTKSVRDNERIQELMQQVEAMQNMIDALQTKHADVQEAVQQIQEQHAEIPQAPPLITALPSVEIPQAPPLTQAAPAAPQAPSLTKVTKTPAARMPPARSDLLDAIRNGVQLKDASRRASVAPVTPAHSRNSSAGDLSEVLKGALAKVKQASRGQEDDEDVNMVDADGWDDEMTGKGERSKMQRKTRRWGRK